MNVVEDKEELKIAEFNDEQDSEYGSYEVSYNLTSYGIDFPVDGLINRYDRGKVYLPSFQRNYVWKKKQASKFIESLLLGLPVPGIFLYKDKDEKLLIIDGYQRIESISRYFRNSFDNRDFRLDGINQDFNGKKYENLRENEKDKIATSIIHATIIKADNPEDKNYHAIYAIFERLNTGGVKLSPQEVRNCVSDGVLRQEITKLANLDVVKKFISIDNTRKKDEEIILRLLALSFDEYTGNMKQFLNDFMFKNKDLDEDNVKKGVDDFLNMVEFLNKINSDEYFRRNDQLSIAILDSLWVGIYKNYDFLQNKSINQIKEKINQLMQDSMYKEAIKTGTTHNVKSVKDRIEKSIEFLRNVQ